MIRGRSFIIRSVAQWCHLLKSKIRKAIYGYCIKFIEEGNFHYQGFSPVVCIGLCHPASVITSSVSSSSSSSASSVQSTSTLPQETSREAGDNRQPRRRSKRRPRPKRKKAGRTGTGIICSKLL